MTDLVLRLPDSLRAERTYAAHVVVQVHLGLSFELIFEHRTDAVVHRPRDTTRTLTLPDLVFRNGDTRWPATAMRPSVIEDPPARPAADVLAGLSATVANDAKHMVLDVDVFGTAFWYLARVEEVLSDARDAHGRFPVEASRDVHQRPCVDELTDALGRTLLELWPALALRRHEFRVAPTHDVDRPFKHLFQSPRALLKGMARDILAGQSIGDVLAAPRRRLQVRRSQVERDPFNTFDWLMNESERHGVRSTFYFICARQPGGIDGDYLIDDPRIREILRRIHARGHLIGLHGSYMSAFDVSLLIEEVCRLRRVCEAERIDLGAIRLRQHVLRFDPRRSVGVWMHAGIAEDSTLGHAGRAGFRCGTCREFPLYDLENRRMTPVIERPLIAMDASLMEPRYEGLTFARAAERIAELATLCRRHGGTFVLLWHNCRLEGMRARLTYAQALADGAALTDSPCRP